MAVYLHSLGSWLPLICWAGLWLYLGFALAPHWHDSDFLPTLFSGLLGFTLALHWLDFEFWLTLPHVNSGCLEPSSGSCFLWALYMLWRAWYGLWWAFVCFGYGVGCVRIG
jgi:hypothetical protein